MNLFVCFESHEQFFSYLATVTFAGDTDANVCLALTAFSRDCSFTCHTYCDTEPLFLRSYPKGPWFSLLNAVLVGFLRRNLNPRVIFLRRNLTPRQYSTRVTFLCNTLELMVWFGFLQEKNAPLPPAVEYWPFSSPHFYVEKWPRGQYSPGVTSLRYIGTSGARTHDLPGAKHYH
jgi:hypothetical protein